jgi:hypothetical protein
MDINTLQQAVSDAWAAESSNQKKKQKHAKLEYELKYRTYFHRNTPTEVIRIGKDRWLDKFVKETDVPEENRSPQLKTEHSKTRNRTVFAHFTGSINEYVRLCDSTKVIDRLLLEGSPQREVKVQWDKSMRHFYLIYPFVDSGWIQDPTKPPFDCNRSIPIVCTDAGIHPFQRYYSPTSGEFGDVLPGLRESIRPRLDQLDTLRSRIGGKKAARAAAAPDQEVPGLLPSATAAQPPRKKRRAGTAAAQSSAPTRRKEKQRPVCSKKEPLKVCHPHPPASVSTPSLSTGNRTAVQRKRTLLRLQRKFRRDNRRETEWMKHQHFAAARVLLSTFYLLIIPVLSVSSLVVKGAQRKLCRSGTRLLQACSHYKFRERLLWASRRMQYANRHILFPGEPGTTKTCTFCGQWNASISNVPNAAAKLIDKMPVRAITFWQPMVWRWVCIGTASTTDRCTWGAATASHKATNFGTTWVVSGAVPIVRGTLSYFLVAHIGWCRTH